MNRSDRQAAAQSRAPASTCFSSSFPYTPCTPFFPSPSLLFSLPDATREPRVHQHFSPENTLNMGSDGSLCCHRRVTSALLSRRHEKATPASRPSQGDTSPTTGVRGERRAIARQTRDAAATRQTDKQRGRE